MNNIPEEFVRYNITEKGHRIPVDDFDDPVSIDLVGSKTPIGTHRVCIDVDFPITVIPSKTEGHYHLYFEGMDPIQWQAYADLLKSLCNCGIIEQGYFNASMSREETFLRAREDVDLPPSSEEVKAKFG